LACVDVPALPLQLLLRRHPEWNEHPAVVVAEDRPQAEILWVNERARRVRVLPGVRYAAALSLCRELRAGVVTSTEIQAGVQEIAGTLRDFTPDVEPYKSDPGTFWADLKGLERLFDSASAWARAVRSAIERLGFRVALALGFTRFGCYASAKDRLAGQGSADGGWTHIFRTPEHESQRMRSVQLERLVLEPRLRESLARLGVRTVGALIDLPAAGLLERYGPEAYRLHQLAAGKSWSPLAVQAAELPTAEKLTLEFAEGDLFRLLFLIKGALDTLLVELADRQEALVELKLELSLESGTRRKVRVKPAEPTLDGIQLLELVRLHLERELREENTRRRMEGFIAAGVEELELKVEGVRAPGEQLRLFVENPRRDLKSASRALARVRAELGSHAVARARLNDGHLPEATFLWEPLEDLQALKPAQQQLGAKTTLVRRIHTRRVALPPRPHHLRDDGWLIRGAEHGAVTRMTGPYIISGGWWARPVHREYHFAETVRGDLLWVYYDRRRRKWFLHGEVC